MLTAEVERLNAALLVSQKDSSKSSSSASKASAAASAREAGAPPAMCSWSRSKVSPVCAHSCECAAEERARLLSQLEARAVEAESEVIRQQARIAALTADVHAWEETVSKQASQHSEAARKLQDECDGKASEIAQLRRELSARPSVTEVAGLKQQLGALQALYFNAEDESGTMESGVCLLVMFAAAFPRG